MAITARAKQITERLYTAFGTHSGILLGIPSHLRSSVEAIVQQTLDIENEQDTEPIEVNDEENE